MPGKHRISGLHAHYSNDLSLSDESVGADKETLSKDFVVSEDLATDTNTASDEIAKLALQLPQIQKDINEYLTERIESASSNGVDSPAEVIDEDDLDSEGEDGE
ncbi:hypothetical protein V1511DRAFT_485189 [Dipodascopsis uninucleata]